MAHVEDRGKDAGRKRWRVRWRDPSGKHHSKSFDRKDEAERFARDLATRLDRGDYIDPAQGRTQFSEVARIWMAKKYALDRKPSTLVDYESLLKVLIIPELGRFPVAGIRYDDVVKFSHEMEEKGLSASRRRRALGVVSQVLDEAIRRSMLTTNVARLVELPEVPMRPRHRYLTHRQLDSLSNASREYRTFVLLLGYTGLRYGEAVALRPGDIDLNRRRIHVHRSQTEATGRVEYVAPKSGKPRTVPVVDQVCEQLEPIINGDPERLLFTSPKGGPIRHSNFVGSRWTPAVDATVGRPLRIHDLRHTAASLARASGADAFIVARMLGHADAKMTTRVYADLFDDELDLIQRRLSASAGDALGTRETGTERDGE